VEALEMDDTTVHAKILNGLAEITKDLQSLSDNIWGNFDHSNNEALDKFVNFKKKFNNLLSGYKNVHRNFHELFKDCPYTYKTEQSTISVPKPGQKDSKNEISPNKIPSPIDLRFSIILEKYKNRIKSQTEKKVILKTELGCDLEISQIEDTLYLKYLTDTDKPNKILKLSVLTSNEKVKEAINRLIYDRPRVRTPEPRG
jgi:hypothetical protein